jgi:hypothetical protein
MAALMAMEAMVMYTEREKVREREFFLSFDNCIYIMQEGLVDTAVQ